MAKNKSLRQKKFSLKHLAVTAVIFGLFGGLVGWAAFAAPHGGGGKTGGASITGPVMVTDNNHDGMANWGDTITFNVTDSTTYPTVNLACYQNGSLVYNAIVGYFPGYAWPKQFVLSSTSWTGGAANCTAYLYHDTNSGKKVIDATLSFNANA